MTAIIDASFLVSLTNPLNFVDAAIAAVAERPGATAKNHEDWSGKFANEPPSIL